MCRLPWVCTLEVALSVFRGKLDGGRSKDISAFWCPLPVFGGDIKVGRSHHNILAL